MKTHKLILLSALMAVLFVAPGHAMSTHYGPRGFLLASSFSSVAGTFQQVDDWHHHGRHHRWHHHHYWRDYDDGPRYHHHFRGYYYDPFLRYRSHYYPYYNRLYWSGFEFHIGL